MVISASNNAESDSAFSYGDGSVLAMAADENDGGGTDAGHVEFLNCLKIKKFRSQLVNSYI